MKLLWIALISLAEASSSLPHWDLEMTSAEYARLLPFVELKTADPLQEYLRLGKRNLDWIEHINARRPDGAKLQLSTPETQGGIPIDQPSESNRDLIRKRYAVAEAALPAFMREVLLEGKPFHDAAPISDEEFLVHLRAIDRIYQYASRWLLQEPYLAEYAEFSKEDVRGIYYLRKEKDIEGVLADWSMLPAARKAELSGWLKGICRNAAHSVDRCARDFTEAELLGRVPEFYRKHLPHAEMTWESYFALENPRPEARWSSQYPGQFLFPFLDPQDARVRTFLKDNIEDEWKWGKWALTFEFRQNPKGLARIRFEPGATPHVNGLGGDTITMDANRSLEEYSTRWTIRHEFGHVLGLPDCYIEFYDESRAVMVSYQIDITNLMCSRKGKLQERHVLELRKHYYRP
jgi:hypothetical protein